MSKIVRCFVGSFFLVGLNSCALVAGIFRAGFRAGVLLVLVIFGLILFLVFRRSGKN
jgi:hypothetical protein